MLGRHRIASIALSLTHDRTSASAVALAKPARIEPPLAGRPLHLSLPAAAPRGRSLENLRRVYGDTLPEAEIARLAQAHYGHLWRLAGEFLRFRWLSPAQQLALVRVENLEAFVAAQRRRARAS